MLAVPETQVKRMAISRVMCWEPQDGPRAPQCTIERTVQRRCLVHAQDGGVPRTDGVAGREEQALEGLVGGDGDAG